MSRRTIIVAGAVALVAVGIITLLFYCYARDTFAEWLATLLATFIGALLATATGVGLFNYQAKQNEEGRRKQLEAALVGELQATLDVLESSPSLKLPPPPEAEEGETAVEVVLTHLEPVACEETIRNAISSSADVMALSHLARAMRTYNAEAERLEAFLDGVMVTNKDLRDFRAAKAVKRAQESVISFCRINLESFRDEGAQIPPRHYSRDLAAEPEEPPLPD